VYVFTERRGAKGLGWVFVFDKYRMYGGRGEGGGGREEEVYSIGLTAILI
jgi:hypothetical protein